MAKKSIKKRLKTKTVKPLIKSKVKVLPNTNSLETVKPKNPIRNSKPFPKGTSGNPKGRPPKLLSHVIAELKKKGFERVSPSQISEAYEILFNLSREEINSWSNNDKAPMFMRIVAKAMLSKKGVEMIERMMDRVHGKSRQSIEVKAEITTVDDIDYTKLSDGALKEVIALREQSRS